MKPPLSTTEKIFHKASYATIMLVIGIITYVSFYTFWDFNPIDLYNENGTAKAFDESASSYYDLEIIDEDKKLERGSHHFYNVNYCRHTDVSVKVEKHLVDGIFIEINDVPTENRDHVSSRGGSFGIGCDNIDIPFYLSEKIPLGKYRLRSRVDYLYSPIRTVPITFFTETFEVIEKEL